MDILTFLEKYAYCTSMHFNIYNNFLMYSNKIQNK